MLPPLFVDGPWDTWFECKAKEIFAIDPKVLVK
jgi:hypothetical protein